MLENVPSRSDAAQRSRGAPKVLFVTSEMGGYLKSGGLGEVAAALPRALKSLCDIRVLLPAYPSVRRQHGIIDIVSEVPATADLPAWSLGRVKTPDGLVVYLVVCDELYDRDGSAYGGFDGVDYDDNDIRFARLSLAAAEIAEGRADPNWAPDMVHANDWPSALTPAYLKWKGLDTSSILTIHNLAYQGVFDASRLDALAIPDHAMTIDGVEFYGKLSFLKAGIAYSSHVTTVSQTYAHEITTAQHGCGLDGLLRLRAERGELTGIVNGIDESWSEVSRAAGASGFLPRWKAKKAEEVRHAFGLDPSDGPLFSIISRLVRQKGIDLSIGAADMIVQNGGQLVVTGRGEPALEEAVRALAARHPGKVAAHIGFDDSEARTIFGGSDFLLMPSRFEPCGLSQMYAQSQGALPIAHRTGGLVDTIDDGQSGFLFGSSDGFALRRAVSRSLQAFRSAATIRRMRRFALSKQFSWAKSAERYNSLYAAV